VTQGSLLLQAGEPTATFGMALGVFDDGISQYGWIQGQYVDNAGTTRPLSLNPIGGNVGIGTTSPGHALDVAGNIRSTSSDDFGGFLYLKRPSGEHYQFVGPRDIDDVTYKPMIIHYYNGATYTEIMTFRNNGNIGLGTSTPNSKLQVNAGDVYVDTIGNGIIIKSPNGTCWRVTVDNTGAFVSTSITCP